MSRMIPSTIHPDVKSNAEKRIFKLLRDAEHTNDWIVLHSLGLAKHHYKRRGEIDFLILCSRGVFVIEVKGGRITREGGKWKTRNMYGDLNNLHESPYDQASSAMFSLERNVKKEFDKDTRMKKLIFGYGVICPNTSERDLPFGADGDRALTYTLEDTREPITKYIGRIAGFIEKQTPSNKNNPTSEELEKLLKYLRGDFDCVPSLSIKSGDISAQLMELTEEQYAVLDITSRKQRVICRGAAGTGKTMLALREAINSSREGKKVLVLCFNRNLADYLAYILKDEKCIDTLKVDSIHRFMSDLISSSSVNSEFLEMKKEVSKDELFKEIYPYFASLANIDETPWDKIIIDEGQDFLTTEMLDFLDTCLDGGLECGNWRWFMDDNNQAGVYGHLDIESVDRLERFGVSQMLTVNCRNTRQIHEETLMMVKPDIGSVAKIDGLPVRYAWFNDTKGQISALERQLKRLKDGGISSSEIIILSARSLEQSFINDMDSSLVKQYELSDYISSKDDLISCATISAFKGLESPIVILTDIEEIEGEWWSSVLYVGMSRAGVELVVLLPEKLKSLYERRLKDLISAIEEED